MNPQPRRTRRWPWLLSGVFLVFAMLIAGYAFLFSRQREREEQAVREAVAETDRLDPGWTLEEIEAKRIALPDERNSAVQVMKIKALLPASWPQIPTPTVAADDDSPAPEAFDAPSPVPWHERVLAVPPEIALDAELVKELRAELKKIQPAVDAARLLADLPDGRYPVVWKPNTLSTILLCQDARVVAYLLRLDAMQTANDNRPDVALRQVHALLNCARSIGDEPSMISQLVRVADTAIAVSTLERVLAQTEPSPPALEEMQRLLEREIGVPIAYYMARGERATQYHLNRNLMAGTVRMSQMGGPSKSITDVLEDRQGAAMARRGIPKMLRYFTDFVEVTRLPPEQIQARMQKIVPTFDNSKAEDIMLVLLLPALDKVALAHLRQQALLRSAAVAIAAERFRRDHGQWPKNLPELAPQYISAPPLDPFDGQPLRLRTFKAGIVVYSVGYDSKDDGGNINPSKMTQPGYDIGFRLWDVAARRQVAERLRMPRRDPTDPPDDEDLDMPGGPAFPKMK